MVGASPVGVYTEGKMAVSSDGMYWTVPAAPPFTGRRGDINNIVYANIGVFYVLGTNDRSSETQSYSWGWANSYDGEVVNIVYCFIV